MEQHWPDMRQFVLEPILRGLAQGTLPEAELLLILFRYHLISMPFLPMLHARLCWFNHPRNVGMSMSSHVLQTRSSVQGASTGGVRALGGHRLDLRSCTVPSMARCCRVPACWHGRLKPSRHVLWQ